MALKPVIRDVAPIYIAAGVFCIALFALASCKTTPPKSPYSAIWPGNPVQTQSGANLPVARRLSVVLTPPKIPISLTFDTGSGPADGIHVYSANTGQSLSLLATFPYTNLFQVNVPTNVPTLIEVRTLINWPPPYLISSYIDENGNEIDTTNTYRETAIGGTLTVSDYIFTPTNCASIGLFQMNDGTLQLAGWANAPLVIQQSQDLVAWSNVAAITNLGAWQVTVDSSQPHSFWRTSQAP
jgi:hypothetical protein